MNTTVTNNAQKSSCPAWTTHISPYTFILIDDTSDLNITIDQVNDENYDANHLSKIVASLPLQSINGLNALLSFDGSISIPRSQEFATNSLGLNKLNEILCSLVIGGIYTEVLYSKNLESGKLENSDSIFSFTPTLYTRLRLKWTDIAERMVLMNARKVKVTDIQNAYTLGQNVLKKIQTITPFFLLAGFTSLIHNNKSEALNNLWISIEQITEFFWLNLFLPQLTTFPSAVTTLHTKYKKENKLDKIFAKHELLALSNLISVDCLNDLNKARTTRNDLAHKGIEPAFIVVNSLWSRFPELLEKGSNESLTDFKNFTAFENVIGTGTNTNFQDWETLSKAL